MLVRQRSISEDVAIWYIVGWDCGCTNCVQMQCILSIFTGSQLSVFFLFVLDIPGRGLFILPFGVAGDGARYRLMSLGFMSGMPLNWPLAMAFRRVAGGRLKKVWCMYFICCCLYGRVYKDVAAVCLTLLSVISKSRCCDGSFSCGLIGLVGSRHKSVMGHQPPTNTNLRCMCGSIGWCCRWGV